MIAPSDSALAARRPASLGRLAVLFVVAFLAATALSAIAAGEALADHVNFGISEFDGSFTDADGSPAAQAGSRPFTATNSIRFNTTTNEEGETVPDGSVKDVVVDLPPGVAGDFTKLPRCTSEQLAGMIVSPQTDSCPIDSQVGVLKVFLDGPDDPNFFPIFNMVPPPGTPADFGSPVLAVTVRLTPSVRTGGDYGIRFSSLNTSSILRVYGVEATFWGVPSDSSHDTERHPCLDTDGPTGSSCPVTFPRFPLLTMPTSCTGPLPTTLRADPWQHIGAFDQASFQSHDDAGNPYGLHGCALLRFDPSATAAPDTSAADSPTGLHFNLHLPQNDNPDGLATAHLRDVRVELPEGLTVNPSSADGLAGCSSAQVDISGPGPAQCPNAAKIGTARIHSPLVDDPLEGALYVAEPFDNPFGSLLALYLSVDDPQTGVVIKVAGEVSADPDTGRLSTVFEQNPQLPFEDLEVSLFGGPRAPLRSPPTCGIYTGRGELTPWSFPATPKANLTVASAVDQAPGGGPCVAGDPDQPADPSDRADLPFAPRLSAGTLHPLAGQHSPFVLRLTRQDGEQELTRLTADLPPGLTGKLAGVARCSDATLAGIPTAPGTGAAEKANPSCPAASRLGRVEVGAGAGSTPLYISGQVYLAGPHQGAPLSIAVVTPAVAGPFDLGNVVIRSKLMVDPDDAQLHVDSGPLPTILEGIPLDIRDIRVVIDRPGFTLNPTNCDPMTVTGTVNGASAELTDPADDITAPLSDRFQVGGCGGLGFSPKMTTTLLNGKQGVGRSAHPNLLFNLTGNAGDANLRRVEVLLPSSFQIDQANLGNICSETQLAQNDCAGRQRVGTATARTPLLDQPLSGPVYAVSGSGGLPKLAVILYGPPELPIKLVVRGETSTVGARIKNTFPLVPDAPVSSFALNIDGGPQGYLVNNRNLCTKVKRTKGKNGKKRKRLVRARGSTSDITYFGQNGDTLRQRSTVAVKCGKSKKKKRKRRR